jgi:hypothetical protein
MLFLDHKSFMRYRQEDMIDYTLYTRFLREDSIINHTLMFGLKGCF